MKMKQVILIILLFAVPLLASAGFYSDEYICSNGWKISKKDSVLLGEGSLSNGNFAAIKMFEKPHTALPATFNNKKIFVRYIFTPPSTTNKNVRIYFVAEDGEKYSIEVEKALAKKEIVPPKEYWDYKKNGSAPPLTFKGFLDAGNATTEVVFDKIKEWFKKSFNDSRVSFKTINANKGLFLAHMLYPYHSAIALGNDATKGYVECELEIRREEGKYKYMFTDFRHFADPNNHPDSYFFSLLTVETKCPANKIYFYHGTRWSNKVWVELKYSADTFSSHTISKLQKMISQ